MNLENWEHFFKPEVRSSGRKYYTAGNVSISQPSDTEIQAFIRGSSPIKVNLKSASVSSPLVSADCTCPLSKKGQLCKHIWATLLTVADKRPDFLDGKEDIEKRTQHETASKQSDQKFSKPSFKLQPKPLTEAQQASQAAYKAKQDDYRKQRYQQQKQWLKEKKLASKMKETSTPNLPEDVESALHFFEQNGFPIETPIKPEEVQLAKKKLARIFHPDIGGQHDEILELNKHSEALLQYAEPKKNA